MVAFEGREKTSRFCLIEIKVGNIRFLKTFRRLAEEVHLRVIVVLHYGSFKRDVAT